jgi:hypothetical protein
MGARKQGPRLGAGDASRRPVQAADTRRASSRERCEKAAPGMEIRHAH